MKQTFFASLALSTEGRTTRRIAVSGADQRGDSVGKMTALIAPYYPKVARWILLVAGTAAVMPVQWLHSSADTSE